MEVILNSPSPTKPVYKEKGFISNNEIFHSKQLKNILQYLFMTAIVFCFIICLKIKMKDFHNSSEMWSIYLSCFPKK